MVNKKERSVTEIAQSCLAKLDQMDKILNRPLEADIPKKDVKLHEAFRKWGYDWAVTAKGLPIWEEQILPQFAEALKEYYENHKDEIWPPEVLKKVKI